MNKEKKQILKNQVRIMKQLIRIAKNNDNISPLTEKDISDTQLLLNPSKEPSLPKQTHDTLNVDDEVQHE